MGRIGPMGRMGTCYLTMTIFTLHMADMMFACKGSSSQCSVTLAQLMMVAFHTPAETRSSDIPAGRKYTGIASLIPSLFNRSLVSAMKVDNLPETMMQDGSGLMPLVITPSMS
jgi:hypothetical protein